MRGVFNDTYNIFLIFFIKAYVVGTHLNCLDSLSTNNMCFYKEVDKSTLDII